MATIYTKIDDTDRQNQIRACNEMLQLLDANKTVGMTEIQVRTMRTALINYKEYLAGLVPMVKGLNLPDKNER